MDVSTSSLPPNGPTGPPHIFDRLRWREQRARHAARFEGHDFLHQRAMLDIVDRLETVKRSFPKTVFYGAGDLVHLLTPACQVGEIIHADTVEDRLPATRSGSALIYDEEKNSLPEQEFDLAVSILTLHTVNDLVGALIQYRRILKPDGLFLAVVLGGETLNTVKQVFYSVEASISEGLAARFHPLADIRQWGQAISRAGFALPVTDIDPVAVTYRDPAQLFVDLKMMGERYCLREPQSYLNRAVYQQTLQQLNSLQQPVIFELGFLTGWAPHPDQQIPLKPGSAKASFADSVLQG